MYSIAEDGTLQKDGKMCYCMNTETSCTSLCAAFEERAKDRVWLACMSREIIAKPIPPSPVVNAVKDTPSADPLGLDASVPEITKGKKKGAKKP